MIHEINITDFIVYVLSHSIPKTDFVTLFVVFHWYERNAKFSFEVVLFTDVKPKNKDIWGLMLTTKWDFAFYSASLILENMILQTNLF